MKEQWLMLGAIVPVDAETTTALVAEIKRLIGVVGGMALKQAKQAEQAQPVAQPKLIGWRTENFLWETDDIKKAKSWEPNIGVLPIFEGDQNTSLAPPPPRQPVKVWDAEGYDALCQQLEGWKARALKAEQAQPVASGKLKVTLQDTPTEIELEQYKRMFEAACSALGAIGEALGVDEDEGGAEPILAAIEELKASPPPRKPLTQAEEAAEFKAWFDAWWLGDGEHGQWLPSQGDDLYGNYIAEYTLAFGAWMAAKQAAHGIKGEA